MITCQTHVLPHLLLINRNAFFHHDRHCLRLQQHLVFSYIEPFCAKITKNQHIITDLIEDLYLDQSSTLYLFCKYFRIRRSRCHVPVQSDQRTQISCQPNLLATVFPRSHQTDSSFLHRQAREYQQKSQAETSSVLMYISPYLSSLTNLNIIWKKMFYLLRQKPWKNLNEMKNF